MKPLNLTIQPPRSPRHRLGGVVLLARTIDKLRATLPGGDLGEYKIEGFSARLLRELQIDQEDLCSVIALAAAEDEVVSWVLAHSDPAARERLNEGCGALRIGERASDEAFLTRYPCARELPPETSLFEMLEEDDRRMFAR